MLTPIYVTEERQEVFVPFSRGYEGFVLSRNGNGYFAGTYPDGITSIAGVPVSADIRVLLRSTIDGYGDGAVVAKVKSGVDGTWYVGNLPMGLRYDVVARYAGENDVIMASVTPAPM